MNKKIILIGYMCSGKTIVGKELASKIKAEFLDLDIYIENEEKTSINQIFSEKGELYFRKLEHNYLLDILNKKSSNILIVSLGGGTPCYFNSISLLNRRTDLITIFLKTSIKLLTKRLFKERKNRPIISNISSEIKLNEFVSKHLFERNPFYHKAKHTLVTDNKSVEEIVKEIEKYLT